MPEDLESARSVRGNDSRSGAFYQVNVSHQTSSTHVRTVSLCEGAVAAATAMMRRLRAAKT
eukprot:6903480-Pyramimonas_sp.AAC.1